MRWGEPSLSGLLFGGYLTLLTVLWGGLAAGVPAWRRKFSLPVPGQPSSGQPARRRLSILIPARNEADNITGCVVAALASDHADFEVIVIDDASTDGTGSKALAAGSGDPRLRVVAGTPLPEGWAGKPWACQQASALATGEHLLFIDADVEIRPEAARRAVEVLDGGSLDLLSAFGTWRLETFWERAAIPVIGWFIRGATDIAAVNQAGRPEAFANGQFILVRASAYRAIDGHACVKSEVLDDVRLARAMKQRAHPMGMYHAPELYSVRLYRSLSEILGGYGKNLYEGMDRKPQIALLALLFLFITVGAPWIALILGLTHPATVLMEMGEPLPWLVWIGLTCLLPMGLRFRLERLEGRSGSLAWTQPLGNAVLAAVLLRALFTVRSTWKGRTFHDGKAIGAKKSSG
ncbi:MAG: glycosyltransferase [Myxococcales bacterium]|nr:glycosyltransferase [Myxococcales bacterium]